MEECCGRPGWEQERHTHIHPNRNEKHNVCSTRNRPTIQVASGPGKKVCRQESILWHKRARERLFARTEFVGRLGFVLPSHKIVAPSVRSVGRLNALSRRGPVTDFNHVHWRSNNALRRAALTFALCQCLFCFNCRMGGLTSAHYYLSCHSAVTVAQGRRRRNSSRPAQHPRGPQRAFCSKKGRPDQVPVCAFTALRGPFATTHTESVIIHTGRYHTSLPDTKRSSPFHRHQPRSADTVRPIKTTFENTTQALLQALCRAPFIAGQSAVQNAVVYLDTHPPPP
jgi:hypothetical protein